MLRKIFFITLFLIIKLTSAITVKVFSGPDIEPFEELIAKQRQNQFSQFPYLMDQGEEFEKFYASAYTHALTGALAIAYTDDESIAGFLTGMSLEEFDALWVPYNCELISQKINGKLNPSENYYLGDVIVLEKYRGQRIADTLFKALEEHASQHTFKSASFITIIRAENHPQKPTGYKNPLKVWQRLGYTKSGCIVTYNWPTRQLDNLKNFQLEDNPCDIWVKDLRD